MKNPKNNLAKILIYLGVSLTVRYAVVQYIGDSNMLINTLSIACILIIGIGFIIPGTAHVIEETTYALSIKTKLAGGLLQSFGTAFPDMVIGVVAALLSLTKIQSNPAEAANLAVVAASTTFGSNIYNVLYSAWCIYRQNQANKLNKVINIFPMIKIGGKVKPFSEHPKLPSKVTVDTAINVLTKLSLLTALIAMCMVAFGHVKSPEGMTGDLYQLIPYIGVILFAISAFILFKFRRSTETNPDEGIENEESYYLNANSIRAWLDLFLSAVAILFTAEALVFAIEQICVLTHLSYAIAGVLTGIIGCLGEIMVVHNLMVNPKGRIGDAITGVAMDNVTTILGASIVAIIGGIFLGGNSLIIIFVLILTSNSVLIRQLSELNDNIVN